jgi:hypothetical protein
MTPPRRRSPWLKSQSDSFGPIKQVGVSVAIGLPLFVIGTLFVAILIVSFVGTGAALWFLGAAVLVAGLIAALSGRII